MVENPHLAPAFAHERHIHLFKFKTYKEQLIGAYLCENLNNIT